ncbi:MAG TPA: LuxR C-terminal-related transcriptional regulator [Pseudonocardiaceae bacterium]|jgi:DNA-binding NarL/FixJ family response regulator/DNA-binding Lrp family transcriptional regulator
MWDLLGLDETDESVYRYDVRRPGRAPSQVARSTGLSEETVQACRRRLIAGGLLREERSGVRPTPNGPAMIADRLRDEIDSEYAHRRREVRLLQAEMTRLVNDHLLAGSNGPAPQVDRLPNSEAAAVRVHELLCIARQDVVHAEPGNQATDRRGYELIGPAKIKAAERGVNVRMIYPASTLVSPRIQRAVDDELRAGISVRTAAVPATELTIVDNSVAVLIDRRVSRADQTMMLRDSLLVHALIQLFETTWTHARDATIMLPGTDHGDDDTTELGTDDRLLLQLLSEGLKDELVAKQLGISVRTVRRKISNLLDRLNASSRFQAGVLAYRREWL